MPTLPFHRLEPDLPNSRVRLRPSTTYDVADPGDNLPTPAWWEGRYRIPGGSFVEVGHRVVRLTYTPLSGQDNYTVGASLGVAAGPDNLYDLDASREAQTVVVDPVLPSSNGWDTDAQLVSASGDARSLTVTIYSAIGIFGIATISFGLLQGATPVAPIVGATYVVDFRMFPVQA